MTYLKRHWPDVLIGLLIVVLLAGFASVLLGGNRRLAATPPGSAGTDATRTTPPNTTPSISPAGSGPATSPSTTGGTKSTSTSPSGGAGIPQAPADLPTVPAQPDTTEPSTPAGQSPAQDQATNQNGAATGVDAGTAAGASQSSTTATDQSVPPAGGANPVATSRSGTPTRAEYRLSAGVFASEAAARTRTQAIAALGYTVHIIPIAQGVVAQIGPFADRDTASRALADVQRADRSVVLYAPRGQANPVQTGPTTPQTQANPTQATPSQDTPTPAARTDAAPTPVAPATSTAAPSTAQTPAPTPDATAASDGPVYLQVGAFDDQDRAQQTVQQLRDLGYVPTIIAPPGRKVRVLVGPYAGAALGRTEARLAGNGIDHFRVR